MNVGKSKIYCADTKGNSSKKEGMWVTKHLFSSALCGLPKIDANRSQQLKEKNERAI